MARNTYTTEQIITLLCQPEIQLAQCQPVVAVCRRCRGLQKMAVTPNTYCRWREQCGGLKVDLAKRMTDTERGNAPLKRLLADAHFDAAIPGEAAEGNFRALSVGSGRRNTSARPWGLGAAGLPVLGQARAAQRHERRPGDFEERVWERVVANAERSAGCGYRRGLTLARAERLAVNHTRVESIWRQESLDVSKGQPKRGRLWLTDEACVPLRPTLRSQLLGYSFVKDRTDDIPAYRMLTVIDEASWESLAIRVGRRLNSADVLDRLAGLMLVHDVPERIRSDNGLDFTAELVLKRVSRLGVHTLFIERAARGTTGGVRRPIGRAAVRRTLLTPL